MRVITRLLFPETPTIFRGSASPGAIVGHSGNNEEYGYELSIV
jgi:hypothetical protein